MPTVEFGSGQVEKHNLGDSAFFETLVLAIFKTNERKV